MTSHSTTRDPSHRQSGAPLLPHTWTAEHVALMQGPHGYDLLRRKDDLFEEGVATVFGISQGEAELQAFCFDPDRFTAEQAAGWLLQRGLEPEFFRAGGE